MHRIIDASIDIDASPEEVWSVIVDFNAWESWNDFIPIVEGNLYVGERIRIKVVPPGLKPMTFNPGSENIPPQHMIWYGIADDSCFLVIRRAKSNIVPQNKKPL